MENQVKTFLTQRRAEILKEIHKDCLPVFNPGYDFIEKTMCDNFQEVSPGVVRKIELLEALLFGFIEHGMNLDLLEEVEEQISLVSMRGARSLQ